jgi:GH24 family phage-related lysozyme (muramidase)
MNSNNIFTPAFHIGFVEDRDDPLMLGRVRVRVLGLHTHDKAILPTTDLPWAYKVQPTTSGAMNGIGSAPVGVVEGTCVVVQYADSDKQQPFVVGTIGGIPSKNQTVLDSYEIKPITLYEPVRTGDGSILTTSDGTPVTTEQEQATPTEVQNSFPARAASEYTTSNKLIEFLKEKEGFRANPYQDSAGVWTIGYGTTFIKGVAVTQNTAAVTKDVAIEYVRERLKNEFEPGVKSAIRVPITQGMFDACVDFAYNLGVGGFKKSDVLTALNSGDYETAAANFLKYNKARNSKTGQLEVLKGLTYRREVERDFFLSDGIPTKEGELKETPQSIQKQELDPQSVPNNEKILSGGESGFERKLFTGETGFTDPNKKYPLETHLNEPDTNRLARHQKIRNTIVYTKELAEHKNVPLANGKGNWNQSPTPYNAKYPFNNVWQSESGHVFEFDDTKDRERVHLYHTSGTFNEIDHNGTQVNRVVGDAYTIYERNGFVHVIGNVNVTVDGAKTLRVDNTLDVEVHGATVINIHDNAKLNVAGNLDVSAGGNMNFYAAGNINMKAGGNWATDASRIDLNSGIAQTLPTVSSIGGADVSISPLTVNTRKEEAGTVYETPDDGSYEQVEMYKKERIANATATKEELETKPTVEETTKVEPNEVKEKINPCGIPEGKKDFAPSDKLSKYYTLGDLTAGGSRKIQDNVGLRADEIFCNLKALCENVLDPIKTKYPNVRINSGLRLESTKSQHNTGQAVDVSFPGLSRAELYERVLEIQQLVPHDQMLLEYLTPGGNGWIHISFSTTNNRKQVFTMNNHARVGAIGTFTKLA